MQWSDDIFQIWGQKWRVNQKPFDTQNPKNCHMFDKRTWQLILTLFLIGYHMFMLVIRIQTVLFLRWWSCLQKALIVYSQQKNNLCTCIWSFWRIVCHPCLILCLLLASSHLVKALSRINFLQQLLYEADYDSYPVSAQRLYEVLLIVAFDSEWICRVENTSFQESYQDQFGRSTFI